MLAYGGEFLVEGLAGEEIAEYVGQGGEFGIEIDLRLENGPLVTQGCAGVAESEQGRFGQGFR